MTPKKALPNRAERRIPAPTKKTFASPLLRKNDAKLWARFLRDLDAEEEVATGTISTLDGLLFAVDQRS